MIEGAIGAIVPLQDRSAVRFVIIMSVSPESRLQHVNKLLNMKKVQARVILKVICQLYPKKYIYSPTSILPISEFHIKRVHKPFPNVPYQPDVANIRPHVTGKRTRNFQQHWFGQFACLHYPCALEAILCYPWAKAEYLELNNLAKKRETAFTVTGFRNWKKALEKFEDHANCVSHKFSVQQEEHVSVAKSVDQQMSKQSDCAPGEARGCLTAIWSVSLDLKRQLTCYHWCSFKHWTS
jgi:hypothetical protein